MDIPSAGQLVTVRQRRFVVTEVKPSGLQLDMSSPVADQKLQHLVELDLSERPPPQIGFEFDAGPAPSGGAADDLSPDAAALRASPTPLGKSALLEAARLPDKSWTAAINELKSKNLVTQQGDRRGATYSVRSDA